MFFLFLFLFLFLPQEAIRVDEVGVILTGDGREALPEEDDQEEEEEDERLRGVGWVRAGD